MPRMASAALKLPMRATWWKYSNRLESMTFLPPGVAGRVRARSAAFFTYTSLNIPPRGCIRGGCALSHICEEALIGGSTGEERDFGRREPQFLQHLHGVHPRLGGR